MSNAETLARVVLEIAADRAAHAHVEYEATGTILLRGSVHYDLTDG